MSKTKTTTNKATTVTTVGNATMQNYKKVCSHIYKTGNTYRVRVSGVSKCFTNRKAALACRRDLLNAKNS